MEPMPPNRAHAVSYIYFALFLVSGVSGLIYESAWSQYLKQFLGHAAYAQTLVLVIYMGGMAVGAWLAALWAARARNLLLAYAVVELALGALALAFHDAFLAYVDASFETVIPALSSAPLISIYKWATASLIILPQSMLLGATFPLMAGGILRRFPGTSGYKTSVIYFVNTLGASAGVLICGFYLVKEWGLKGAIISGGIIDVFVGAAVMALCLADRRRAPDGTDAPARDATVPIDDDDPGVAVIPEKRECYWPLMFVAGGTAAASFMYEIGWIRMLSLVLGSSTHSFELMLCAFILGIALGSFFARKRLDTTRNAPRFLALAQIAMGMAALSTLFTCGYTFRAMAFAMEGLAKTPEGYALFNLAGGAICVAVMLPSTICAGMVVPLIIHMLYKKGYGEQAIGKAYAVNTFGGIVGVVAAGWFLMELVGLKYLIAIGGAIDMALGLYVLRRFPETRGGRAQLLARPACALALLAALAFARVDPVLASSGVFRYGTISKAKRVVAHKDGRTASITLFRSGDNLVLSTNGKPDASVGTTEEYSGDEYTMALLGALPLSAREETRTAAVIGMGAGMTAHYMLYDPAIDTLDVVEIEPAMVALARRMGPKVENTFNDRRCRIHIEDAKTFFSARNRSYDVIVSEPSNPWVSGVSSLFSREFFSRVRRHINDGGMLVQWFHKYEADVTILASILKALGESFPVYDMYMAGSDLIVLAAKDAGTDIGIKRDIFVFAPVAENLGAMGFSGIDDFRLLRYAGREFLDPFVRSYPAPPNSDYHSFVDLHAVRYRFMGSAVKEIDDIREFIVPVRKIVFADTGYIGLVPLKSGLLPDIHNLYDIQKAKTLAQELIVSEFDAAPEGSQKESVSASVFILDYASARPDKISFAQIQSAIIQILRKTLPYLSAEEMRDVWGIVERRLSGYAFADSDMEWMAYFKALCLYDLPEMRRLSLRLLPADSISEHYSNQMLIASLLAASKALGDTVGVGRVWERYDEREDPPAAVRAIRAMMMR